MPKTEGLCGAFIPNERLKSVPGTTLCAKCQESEEQGNPNSVRRKVDNGIGGSRESWAKKRKGYIGDGRFQ